MTGQDPDPLAKITLSPRAFVTVLATVALLLGLLLALIPVRVAGPDPANPVSVSCGNTIGGVETGSVAANLEPPDRATIVSYIEMCERAVGNRVFYSWPLFLIGGLVIIWMGVVRPRSASPDSSPHVDPEPTLPLPARQFPASQPPAPDMERDPLPPRGGA